MPAPAETARPYFQGGPRADIGGFGMRTEVSRRQTSIMASGSGASGESPAAAYQKKWEGGGQLYTEGTGKVETPLLAALIGGLPRGERGKRLVIEAGAGSGDQAFHLATQLPNTNVVALDTSPAAIGRIHERAPGFQDTFAPGSQLTVALRDLQESVDGLRPGSLHGFHANSVFHFIPELQRERLLGSLSEKLTPEGLVAVSYKAFDPEDALVSDPRTRVSPDHGKGYLVVPPDGIQRLFVDRTNTDPIAGEFTNAGLDVVGTYSWAVTGYDREGQDSHFVGFLARKPAV